jgi:hypothetical protein
MQGIEYVAFEADARDSGKRIHCRLTRGYLTVDRECHSCSSATWQADRQLNANTWTLDS